VINSARIGTAPGFIADGNLRTCVKLWSLNEEEQRMRYTVEDKTANIVVSVDDEIVGLSIERQSWKWPRTVEDLYCVPPGGYPASVVLYVGVGVILLRIGNIGWEWDRRTGEFVGSETYPEPPSKMKGLLMLAEKFGWTAEVDHDGGALLTLEKACRDVFIHVAADGCWDFQIHAPFAHEGTILVANHFTQLRLDDQSFEYFQECLRKVESAYPQ
jgi:hypothetical protein